MDFLEGKTIFKKNGAELTPVEVNDAFKDVKMTAYYFGAKWCDDCVKFSPLLRDVYNEAKDNGESFEVIYVSSDKSEDEMREFVSEFHPDWYVFYVNEDDVTSDDFELIWEVRSYLDINGIPNVAVMKENSQCASMDGVSDVINKGYQTLAYWKENVIDRDEYDAETIRRTPENEGKIIPNCCSISKFKPWVATSPLDIMANKKIMRKVDNEFKTEELTTLSDKEVVGFYFSAHWCPPCRHFTPLLKKCYDETTEKKDPFEVIFISYDGSEEELKKYMLEAHGDWLVLESSEKMANRLLSNTFSVEGIPSLAIVNKKGELLTLDATQDIEIQGAEAVSRWMQGVPAVTEEERDAFYERLQKEAGKEDEKATEEEKSEEN